MPDDLGARKGGGRRAQEGAACAGRNRPVRGSDPASSAPQARTLARTAWRCGDKTRAGEPGMRCILGGGAFGAIDIGKACKGLLRRVDRHDLPVRSGTASANP